MKIFGLLKKIEKLEDRVAALEWEIMFLQNDNMVSIQITKRLDWQYLLQMAQSYGYYYFAHDGSNVRFIKKGDLKNENY